MHTTDPMDHAVLAAWLTIEAAIKAIVILYAIVTALIAPTAPAAPTQPAPAAPIAPAINPLYAAQASLDRAFSVRTFTNTHGVKKARTKYQQIAAYIAR